MEKFTDKELKEIEDLVEIEKYKGDWEEVVNLKIKIAKSRGSRKRGWIKLTKSWLTSSINYRMTLDEIAVFSKFLVMSDEFGPVPGLISDNDFRPMPNEYLAHQACCPLEVFESVLKKGIADNSLYKNSHGIFLTHFDDYQFTEFDRQKPYRDRKREEAQKFQKVKYCPECKWNIEDSKKFERMEICPHCKKKRNKEVLLIKREVPR